MKKLFNLNKTIGIKFTNEGLEYLAKTYNEYLPQDKKRSIEDFKKRKDEEGYYFMQMWEFIDIFGNMIYMGSNSDRYFTLSILIDDSDLEPVEKEIPRIMEETRYMELANLGITTKFDTHIRIKSLKFNGYNRNDIEDFVAGIEPKYEPSDVYYSGFSITLNEGKMGANIKVGMTVCCENGEFYLK